MRDPQAGTALTYYVLGPLLVRDSAGEPVPITADKPRRLLTELLLRRNSWVDVDMLIEALWATKTPPDSARGNLKTYVHQLRQLLPGDGPDSAISSRRGNYQLAVAPGELDSDVFEELIARGRAALDADDPAGAATAHRDALALWRGDPDRDVAGPGAQVEAARLRELRWDARDGLADALIASGRAEEAVATLRASTVEEPLREATWTRLVAALRDAARPADALAAYQEIRDKLVAELGAEPGSALRELHTALLADTEGTATNGAGTEGPAAEGAGFKGTAALEARHDSSEPADPVAPHGISRPVEAPAPPRSRVARWVATRPAAVRVAAVGCVLALLAVGTVFIVDRSTSPDPDQAAAGMSGEATPSLAASGVAPRRSVPGFPAGPAQDPKLLFGLGAEATAAARTPLATETPVGMLSSWYDGPKDLPQYESWRDEVVPGYYAQGLAMHLVLVPSHAEPEPVETKFGPGCGKSYPLSPRFLDDMRRLATSFAGAADGPPLYVSVFDGLTKLACTEDGYHADKLTENYYNAIKDRYLEVRQIFHQNAPNARVALNWDGWQGSSDDPNMGSGRSLMEFFSSAMSASDFQSFNAFEEEDNADDVAGMVEQLGRFGPVMVSNFGPYNDPEGVRLRSDLDRVFAPEQLARLTQNGLFAWTFWENKYLDAPEAYAAAKDVVTRHGRR